MVFTSIVGSDYYIQYIYRMPPRSSGKGVPELYPKHCTRYHAETSFKTTELQHTIGTMQASMILMLCCLQVGRVLFVFYFGV